MIKYGNLNALKIIIEEILSISYNKKGSISIPIVVKLEKILKTIEKDIEINNKLTEEIRKECCNEIKKRDKVFFEIKKGYEDIFYKKNIELLDCNSDQFNKLNEEELIEVVKAIEEETTLRIGDLKKIHDLLKEGYRY